MPSFNHILLLFQIAERSEEASKASLEKQEMARRLNETSQKFEDEKINSIDLTQQMTRQYKGMQEELLHRIKKLEDTILQLRDKLAQAVCIRSFTVTYYIPLIPSILSLYPFLYTLILTVYTHRMPVKSRSYATRMRSYSRERTISLT